MDRPAVEEYLTKTRERIDRAGHLFSVSFEGLGTSVDLMAEASEQLAQVAVREHMASTRVEMQRDAVEHAKQELESKNQELQERATRDPLTKSLQSRILRRGAQRGDRRSQPVRRTAGRTVQRHRSLQACQR